MEDWKARNRGYYRHLRIHAVIMAIVLGGLPFLSEHGGLICSAFLVAPVGLGLLFAKCCQGSRWAFWVALFYAYGGFLFVLGCCSYTLWFDRDSIVELVFIIMPILVVFALIPFGAVAGILVANRDVQKDSA